MAKQRDPEIHALTVAEVGRQVGELTRQRQAMAAELAAIEDAHKAGAPEEPTLSDRAKAKRERLREVVNGYGPASLALPPTVTRREFLRLEIEVCDEALLILSRAELVARAAAAVQFVEERGPEWRTVCREIALTAFRLRALEERAQRISEELPAPIAGLPLAQFVGNGHSLLLDYLLVDFQTAALAEHIVTTAELRQLEKVK